MIDPAGGATIHGCAMLNCRQCRLDKAELRLLRALLAASQIEVDRCVLAGNAHLHSGNLCDSINAILGPASPPTDPPA